MKLWPIPGRRSRSMSVMTFPTTFRIFPPTFLVFGMLTFALLFVLFFATTFRLDFRFATALVVNVILIWSEKVIKPHFFRWSISKLFPTQNCVHVVMDRIKLIYVLHDRQNLNCSQAAWNVLYLHLVPPPWQNKYAPHFFGNSISSVDNRKCSTGQIAKPWLIFNSLLIYNNVPSDVSLIVSLLQLCQPKCAC